MKTATALLILAALFLGLGLEYMSNATAIFFAIVIAVLTWRTSK